jgi:tetratricopeptide (TPR) repeat protein
LNFRFVTACVIVLILVPVIVTAADAPAELQSAGALYSKSVDLSNEGKYKEALQAADQALALNVSSLMPVIQANRAGILTVTGKYDEALIAADAALASEGNLTTTHAIAWYNKGDALRYLGRVDEAKTAFARAQALDPTLIPPKDLTAPIAPILTTAKSSLPGSLAIGALAMVLIIGGILPRTKG